MFKQSLDVHEIDRELERVSGIQDQQEGFSEHFIEDSRKNT
jgi:hypothetical protein